MKPYKFLIVSNPQKDLNGKEALRIDQFLTGSGCTVTYLSSQEAEPPVDAAQNRVVHAVEEIEEGTIALILGGDGSMLGAGRFLRGRNIPILGINMGHMGFLTECERQESIEVLTRILRGEYSLESRSMLNGKLCHADGTCTEFWTVNDAALTRGASTHMLSLHVTVNDDYLDTISGDGIVIATPTGSTAYNLSAGGPIMVPAANAMIVTPICARSLSMRSFILDEKDILRLRIMQSSATEQYHSWNLVTDGQQSFPVSSDDLLEIRIVPDSYRMVRTGKRTFFQTLREKLFNE